MRLSPRGFEHRVEADLAFGRARLHRELAFIVGKDDPPVYDKTTDHPFKGTPVKDAEAICLTDLVGIVCLGTGRQAGTEP